MEIQLTSPFRNIYMYVFGRIRQWPIHTPLNPRYILEIWGFS